MEISCNIIKDLLPLYAEELVSDDSRKMVDDHLCTCDSCKKELAAIKKTPQVPLETDVKSLKRVGDSIRRRRVLAALAAIMTVLTLGVTVCTYLFVPYYLTAEEAIEGVELREDGGLAIDYARGVTGISGYGHLDENNWGIICRTTRYDWYLGQKRDAELAAYTEEELKAYIADFYDTEECTQRDWDRFFNIQVDHGTVRRENGEVIPAHVADRYLDEKLEWVERPYEENHWYLEPSSGDVEVLLWDAGQPYPDSVLATTTNLYAVVFYSSLILAVLLFLVSRRMFGTAKELAIRGTIVFGSIAFSTLLATNGQLIGLDGYDWKEFVIAEALFVSLTSVLWYQIWRYRKADKIS